MLPLLLLTHSFGSISNESLDDIDAAVAAEFDEDCDYLLRQSELEAWSVTVDKKAVKKMNSRDIKRQDHIWGEFLDDKVLRARLDEYW